ncbi:hypothetical protein HELRODRAFT_179529 [Helobdella robusta]|uniref:Apple domain-containing protein n=1 Tax=Helobdella robusta TaxID=6412 RepID=T1FEU8_HELRO|nr:hypothetical protein HELRODRAFT_179529 [Helobdella robusta]ESN95202.1 hypothetical protein HELRODRAFT_179529 [Helobdella robusta]
MFTRSIFLLLLSNLLVRSLKNLNDPQILKPSFSPLTSLKYTMVRSSLMSNCYPDASETTQYSVRSVQRCAAHCSVLPTCRRFNYYYQSNVYGTAGDCRLFPSSNCHHVPQINGFLAYVNNAPWDAQQLIIETTTTTASSHLGYNCGSMDPCKIFNNRTTTVIEYFSHSDSDKFIQCDGTTCNVKTCPPDSINCAKP